MSKRFLAFWLIVIFVMTKAEIQTGLIGNWGGEHISLELTEQGGSVEYDCAHGVIEQKVVLDGQGRFDVLGTHIEEHGGPVRETDKPRSIPVRFSGQIQAGQMTLRVTHRKTKKRIGTFMLRLGEEPFLVKCR